MEAGRQGWRRGRQSGGRGRTSSGRGRSQNQTYISSSSSSEYEISSGDEENSDAETSSLLLVRTLPTSTSTMASLRLHLELKLRKARKGGGRRRRSSEEGEEVSRSCEKKVMVRPRKKIVREESATLDLRNRSSDESEDDRRTGVEDHLLKLKLGNAKKKKPQKYSSRRKVNQMERDE